MLHNKVGKCYNYLATCSPDFSYADHEVVSAVLYGGCDAHATSPGMSATDVSELL